MYNFELSEPIFLPHCGCQLQLQLAPAEVLVLFGENGIGKSTVLRRFSQMLSDEKRTIVEQKTLEFFFDRKVLTLKQIILESHLPQFDQVAFLDLWEKFGLHEKEDRQLSHLSGGEAQALKLCLSLGKDCQFYLLDEPSQFLDNNRKQILVQKISRLKELGKYVLIVEHHKDWLQAGWKAQELIIENNTLKAGKAWTI